MRVLPAAAVAVALLFAPGVAAAQIKCTDLPKAQDYVSHLRPGPNTAAAQQHLDAAKAAASPEQCVAELKQVDHYARRSAAGDRRYAMRHHLCADAMHQDRPGGTDYRGPDVEGCPPSHR